ncbi:hypothetical protein BDW68DRAFT_173500 [Aspergillus falconensis]
MDMDSLIPLKQPIAIRPEHIAPPIRNNPQPTPLFAADGDFASWTQRRPFWDASSFPLFEVARKKLGMTWYLHLPWGHQGQSRGSGSTDESTATVAPQHSTLKDKSDVHFRNAAPSAGGEEVVLAVRGHYVWKTQNHVYHRGKLVTVDKLTGTGKVPCISPGYDRAGR